MKRHPLALVVVLKETVQVVGLVDAGRPVLRKDLDGVDGALARPHHVVGDHVACRIYQIFKFYPNQLACGLSPVALTATSVGAHST